VNLPDTASAATCTAIAQILPVFMVALVAERIAKLKEPAAFRAQVMLLLATVIRIFFDLALAFTLLTLTFVALLGVEADGLDGSPAKLLWGGSMVMGVAILYRWLLLGTPLLGLLNEANRFWVRLVFDTMEAAGRALPRGVSWLSDVIGRVVLVVSEVLFGFIGAGMFNGALSVSEWLAAKILPAKSAGPKAPANSGTMTDPGSTKPPTAN